MLGANIERQEISAGNQIEKKQYSRETQSTFVKEAELAPRASDRVVAALLNFTKTAYDGLQYKRAADIEEDKLKVNARYKGDPAHKDYEAKTTNGIRLGKVLGSQESVNFHREGVSRFLRMNPEATDEQVAEQTAGMWRNIMEDLGETDTLTVQQVGVLAQDQVQSLYTERAGIRKEHERAIWKQTVEGLAGQAAQEFKGDPKALAATLTNIVETGISPDGEEILLNRMEIEQSIRSMTAAEAETGNNTLLEAQVLNGQIKKNSPEYNSANAKFQSFHISAVMDAATTGDPAKFNAARNDALKSGGMKQDSAAMRQAEKAYTNMRIEQDAVKIGESLAQMERMYKNAPDSGGYERVLAQLNFMQERYPDLMSHSFVQNFLRKIETIDRNGALYDKYVAEDGSDLGINPTITNEERNAIVGLVTEKLTQKEIAIAENSSKYSDAEGNPLEGRALDLAMRSEVLRQSLDFSVKQKIAVPEVQKMLENLTEVNPDTDSGIFHDSVEIFAIASEHMSKESLTINGSKKHVAFLDNFNKYRASLGTEGAFRRAQNIFNQPIEPTKEQRDIQAAIVKEASGLFYKEGFFNTIGNFFTGTEKTSKVQQAYVKKELEVIAMDYANGGSTDPEKIAQYTLEDYAKTNTRLQDGSFVRGTPQQLATALGLVDKEGNAGRNSAILVEEVLNEYKKSMIQQVNSVSRDVIESTRDFTLEVNPYTGMVSIYDTDGYVGLPIALEDLGKKFNNKAVQGRVKAAQDAADKVAEKKAAKLVRQQQFMNM